MWNELSGVISNYFAKFGEKGQVPLTKEGCNEG